MNEKNLLAIEANSNFQIGFQLNGNDVHLRVSPEKRLVDILREDLNLTGTKISCEIGRCGACMVLIDGKPHNSCLTMAYQCDQRKIETIESIGEHKLELIQQTFIEEGGFQCGYCTPGMIMTLKGILNENPKASYEELKEGLSGNLCRCTGYGGILRVLKRVSDIEKNTDKTII
ncbi:(2Fe-2S)-binding protein [Bacillus alkalicellulosilyticus]|uniref:(2Fe-2S)-binding protein n=1 Tax=Alkalihalobacterium alkalicellulosilyticum TaxID=1912214 RepID=UPI0009972948|nr:2Fe-2S iron-sulfur cluster-binding protein [Bacillus alkalicellulosilyticus]